MDVGMHDAEDTRFYLEKGFRVVAVDAQSNFVERARHALGSYIQSGALEIVNCAIGSKEGTIPFYVFPDASDWGTGDPRYVERNRTEGKEYVVIDVPAVRFESLLSRYGIPYYLKIDIEGFDLLCVKALNAFEERPKFISTELTMTTFDEAFESLAALFAAGYRRFKIINQEMAMRVKLPSPAREGLYTKAIFRPGMSGPFGEETPGRWLSSKETVAHLRRIFTIQSLVGPKGRFPFLGRPYNGIARRTRGEPLSWWDIHATIAG
jgi:FkbM family methyltransferase